VRAVVQAALDTLKRKSTSSVCEDESVQSKYNKALSRRTRAEAGVRLLESPAAQVDDIAAMSDVESAQYFEKQAAASLQIKKLQSDLEHASAVATTCVKKMASHKKASTELEYFMERLQGLVDSPSVSTIKTCTVCLSSCSNLVAIECANLHATCFDCVTHRLAQQASFPPETAAAVCCSNPTCLVGFSPTDMYRAVARRPAAVGYLCKAAEVQATAAAFRQVEAETGAQRELGACAFAHNKLQDALVLRCPTPGCNVMFSIEEHDECFALDCSGCNNSFCGLCLVSLADLTNEKDGLYSHAHVRTCCMSSSPGEIFFGSRSFPGERSRIIARLLALNCLKVLCDFGEDIRRRVLLSCTELLERADLSAVEPYLLRPEWQTAEFKRRAKQILEYQEVHPPFPTRAALLYSDQLLDSLIRKESTLRKHLRITQEVVTTYSLFEEMAEQPQFGATDAQKCVFNRNIGNVLTKWAELIEHIKAMKAKKLAIIYAFGGQDVTTEADVSVKEAEFKARELQALYRKVLKPLTDLMIEDASFEAACVFQNAVISYWQSSTTSTYGGTARSKVLPMVHEAMECNSTSPIGFRMQQRWDMVPDGESDDEKSDDDESDYAIQDTSDEEESDSES
jgi:hypothetical protein